MIVYYTTAPTDGPAFVRNILHTRYGIANAQFARGEHGKPRLLNAPLHFSLSHTRGRTFVAVADEPVGLDAEWRGRPLPEAIIQRLSPAEREEDFFRVWTAKEAYIKFCGGTIAGMLPSLRFEHGVLLYRIFKDADALDRYRLGETALDESMLRTTAAHSLTDFARCLVAEAAH